MAGHIKSYYEVIGVERTATDDEIEKSFRELAVKLHPDKNPEKVDEAKAELQILQQAYEVLINPQQRAIYDKDHLIDLLERVYQDLHEYEIRLEGYRKCSWISPSGRRFWDDG